jgi:fructan beta-fructosidase
MNRYSLLYALLLLTNSLMSQSKFQEQYRPQFHFSPPTMWMNDPNGMVYYEGEYHLFYQHYPYNKVWGPMYWGHAISRDLVQWEHLPIALEPDSLGYIFSGSAVVDINNTSGFKTGMNAPLVAMFTYHDMAGEKAGRNNYQYQAIAYSNDRGRTWTKYTGNPVIPNTEGVKDFRDTKVFWHQPSKRWVVVFAVADHVRFYSSKNLKEWTLTSDFGKNQGAHTGVWECPDIFPLKVEGSKTTKWVLLQSLGNGAPNGGSGTQYFIGDFDGKTFKNDNTPETVLWLDYGRDNYAGVTWSNAPQNRRIFLGWMSNWQYAQVVPTDPWRSAMTLPRDLSLKKTAQGIRLVQKPAKETAILRGVNFFSKKNIAVDNNLKINDLSQFLCEVNMDIDLTKSTAKDFHIELSNGKGEVYTIGYDVATNRYYSDRTKAGKNDFSEKFSPTIHYAPRQTKSKKLKMHLFFDKASVELFADNGETVLTDIFFPTEDFVQMRLISNGGKILVSDMKAYALSSIYAK